jgi:hypothetical protein
MPTVTKSLPYGKGRVPLVSDEVYRRQIVDAVAKIERFTAGLDKESFLATEVAF